MINNANICKHGYYVLDLQVREEIGQLLADDDDMPELYLSKKLASISSHVTSEAGDQYSRWFPATPLPLQECPE